ncbi:MAG: M28 family peptidase [Pyrinomonadaceae bacterium]
MKRSFFTLFLLTTFVFQSLAQAPAVKISSDDRKIAEGVTAKQLSDYLYFVASDEMEGRNTPSRGLDTTAKFIAMNLSRWGFKPAGDNGTFFQKIGLKRTAPPPADKPGRFRPFTLNMAEKYDPATMTEPDYVLTQNVVAIWEGSDNVLKNEMVAIGAHYDHIGISQNSATADKINNGADDDGSGTVAVLSIAEALANAPKRPKRSVLFVWHCGEEKGLWGSEYFNKFPTVDLKNVVAQLNIDMIGRSKKADDANPKNKDLTGETAIYVIGKDMMSSTLGAIVDSTNKGYLKLNYDTRYDDPKDKNRFFFRSDHFNYAVNGIPITFWFDGVHEDYHQPGDEPQKIDYNKMEKVARTILITLLKVADLKERPKIDKTLPPELTKK